jgi:hypothetical protein
MRRRQVTRPPMPLTPALQFYLMMGEWGDARLRGWVQLAAVPIHALDAYVREAWVDHADVLTADAAAAGFVPWAASRTRPRGTAVDAWANRFIQAHQY